MSRLFAALMPTHAAIADMAELPPQSVESVSSVVKPLTIDREATLKYEIARIHTELQDLRERTEDLPPIHRGLLNAEYELAELLNSHL